MPLLRKIFLCLALSAFSARAADSLPPDHAERMKKGLELFQKTVAPLLKDNCLRCHGGEKTKGGLDLATREGLLKGGEDGPAIVLWKSGESRLVRLVSHAEKPFMPQKGEALSAESVRALAQWIDWGAPYDSPLVGASPSAGKPGAVSDKERAFWSFLPLKSPPVPPLHPGSRKGGGAISDAANPIDHFIRARLDEKGLKPSPEASPAKLIRRLYLDLLGYPPAPGEVDAFVRDRSPDAYERLVDRLLSDPHFGERWARHWLDAARFGESHGFEQDYDRPFAYWYRDFVIKAFNQDLPYDRFVQWQLAGDELEPGNAWAMAATGFLGAGVFPTQLTESEFEPARYDELDNMASTTGTAFLGLTIGCARCHDHKFDPIPTLDYYRFLSIFTTTIRSEVELDFEPEKHQKAHEQWQAEHAPLVAALHRFETGELPERLERFISDQRKLRRESPALVPWTILDLREFRSAGGATVTPMKDGSVLLGGANADQDTYSFVAETLQTGITSLRIEALAHKSLPKNGPGRAENGNIGLSDLQVTAEPLDGSAAPVALQFARARATFEQNAGLAASLVIDSSKKSGWAVDPQVGRDQAIVLELKEPAGFASGTRLRFTLEHRVNTRHNIGRPRVSIHASGDAEITSAAQAQHELELRTFVDSGATLARMPVAAKEALLRWYRASDPEWKKLNVAVVEHQRREPRPELKKVMITSEGVKPMPHHADDRGFPHFYPKTFFLKRGDTRQKGEEMTPAFLQVLTRSTNGASRWLQAPPTGSKTSGRRKALAQWMTDSRAGAGDLLARVIANRIWQHHFGRGLVATPNDFGAQGERPTHPELLEWLSADLQANGWSLKHLHRLILTSATYRESSDVDEQRLAIDKENREYWHFPRHRLEAEAIRDSMLAVSGTLEDRMFGPGTLDPAMRRRSIYFFIKRSQLVPILMLFDAPEPTVSVGSRVSTTIAPQALHFLNNRQVRQMAESMAHRLGAGSPEDIVKRGYQWTLGRAPQASELAQAAQFLTRQTGRYVADQKGNATELAVVDFCQALFGLNEFIYVE